MQILNLKSEEFFCPPQNQFNVEEEEIYGINIEETFEDILRIPLCEKEG